MQHITDRSEMQCQGKVKFDSMTMAKQQAKKSARRHKGSIMQPYHCPFCHGYHVGEKVGHTPNRKKLKLAKIMITEI